MTTGIYILKFKGTEKVYIGKSKRIEERFTKHKYLLANNKAAYKLQEAYNKYGMPLLHILIECSELELSDMENEAIEIFDSINNGFNIRNSAETGMSRYGISHPNSKYSEYQILTVLSMLTDENNTFKYISEKTKVDISTVRDISKGKSHRWLKDIAYEEYIYAMSIKCLRPSNNALKYKVTNIPIIYHPVHGEYQVDNISEFCRIYSLNKSHISGVLSGKRKSHLGWSMRPNLIK